MKKFLFFAVLAACNVSALAQGQGLPQAIAAAPAAISSDTFLGLETYRLFPGRAEGATSDEPDQTPTLTVFRPQEGRATGAAVVVVPGGGYIALAAILEGREVADWFTARGVTAFVLKYRVGERSRLPVPLADGKRAVRFVRAHAETFKIDPDRIGMIGFSAGGHLSAMTAAAADNGNASARDPVERASGRPAFLVLGYPWLEGTVLDGNGQSPYCTFAKRFAPTADCQARAYQHYVPVQSVTGAMPPTFIYHTTADNVVPVEGSLRFYEALRANRVPVEMHIFANGEHGTGLGGGDPALTHWSALLEAWLRGIGVIGLKR